MGAWGPDSFENDSALDWVGMLVDQNDLTPVVSILKRIGSDSERGDELIAAAEVVAALNGRPSRDLPEELEEWIVDKAPLGPEITAEALRAVDWVWTNSELRELYEEAGSLGRWGKAMGKLRGRLHARPKRRRLKPRDMAKVEARKEELRRFMEQHFPDP